MAGIELIRRWPGAPAAQIAAKLRQQPQSGRRSTSRDGTGSRTAASRSTAQTNAPPYSARAEHDRRRPARRREGVHEVERALVVEPVDQRERRVQRTAVPADVRDLAGRSGEPVDPPGEEAETLGALVLRRRPRTAAACRGRCRAPARPPRARSREQRVEAAARAGRCIAFGNAPTPGSTSPSAARSASWSRVITASRAPTCSSAFSTERRLPMP